MIPNDSGASLSFAGPQMESRSCSGTDTVTGGGSGPQSEQHEKRGREPNEWVSHQRIPAARPIGARRVPLHCSGEWTTRLERIGARTGLLGGAATALGTAAHEVPQVHRRGGSSAPGDDSRHKLPVRRLV